MVLLTHVTGRGDSNAPNELQAEAWYFWHMSQDRDSNPPNELQAGVWYFWHMSQAVVTFWTPYLKISSGCRCLVKEGNESTVRFFDPKMVVAGFNF
jgi:hypothetical protein